MNKKEKSRDETHHNEIRRNIGHAIFLVKVVFPIDEPGGFAFGPVEAVGVPFVPSNYLLLLAFRKLELGRVGVFGSVSFLLCGEFYRGGGIADFVSI